MAETPAQEGQTELRTAGQRRINLLWEATQSAIALMVTIGMLYAALAKIENATITNAAFLIIGFYFSRTNHTKVGGVQGRDER